MGDLDCGRWCGRSGECLCAVLLSCVLCAILFLVLFPSGDQPPLVLLCVKQVGAELCWGISSMRVGGLLYSW